MRINADKYNTFVSNFFENNQEQIAEEIKELGRDLNLTEPLTPTDVLRISGMTTSYFVKIITPILLKSVLENLDDLTEKPE